MLAILGFFRSIVILVSAWHQFQLDIRSRDDDLGAEDAEFLPLPQQLITARTAVSGGGRGRMIIPVPRI